ncbi:MAG: stage III sporulation protein AF [Oscillospiraceae bacterium]|jgi:hypothetical protein|nr:stage III sporulation protein AF [Oscillospiraceae bacterium]
MNQINQWAFVLCLAVVVCSIFDMMSPSGRMQQIMHLVLGAFLICAMIVPIAGSNFKMKFPEKICEENDLGKDLKQEVTNQTKKLAEENLVPFVREILERENIQTEKVEIFMDTEETGSISINKVSVILKKKDIEEINKAERILREKMKAREVLVS